MTSDISTRTSPKTIDIDQDVVNVHFKRRFETFSYSLENSKVLLLCALLATILSYYMKSTRPIFVSLAGVSWFLSFVVIYTTVIRKPENASSFLINTRNQLIALGVIAFISVFVWLAIPSNKETDKIMKELNNMKKTITKETFDGFNEVSLQDKIDGVATS